MRLVVWNCRMALHRPEKWNALTALRPDVAVVPESPNPNLSRMAGVLHTTRAHAWAPSPTKKGLAVYSFDEYGLSALTRATARDDTLPVRVTGPGTSFVLIAVWANKPRYVEHLHDALDAYESLVRTDDVVMAGDFNSNSIWDQPHGDRCHSRLVARLEAIGLASAYHSKRAELQGAETEKTFFSTARGKGQYHIDYVFLPRSWLPRVIQCSIGRREPWLSLSDHCPMMVEVSDAYPPGRVPSTSGTRDHAAVACSDHLTSLAQR
jgi:hypothetical protein